MKVLGHQILASLASLASILTTTTNGVQAQANCSSTAIAKPQLPGAQILSISVNPVVNLTIVTESANPSVETESTVSFCNVTVKYTHPGWEDDIHVTVWLPLSGWNGRLQGIGGGGFASLESPSSLAPAVAEGFAAVGSDAGHDNNASSPASWSLDPASGHVNLAKTQDFFAVALNDAAVVGKAVVQAVYGSGPTYSYWNGCSTGGRQGMMLAQRYPTAYDGIIAGAPAMNWATFIPAEYWPNFVMNNLDTHPSQCVFEAISNASIKACDGLDGVVDGVISAPGLCQFDPHTLVGQAVNCSGATATITDDVATIVQKTWQGARSQDGSFLWYGLNPGAPIEGLASTTCSSPQEVADNNCTGAGFAIATDWFTYFVLQDPDYDLSTISWEFYETLLSESVAGYSSIASSNNPDLFDFKQAGGKMVHWHGLADQLIFPNGSSHYYSAVEARDSSVRDYYRFFEAPGVQHCGEGVGAQPSNILDALMNWVEKGVAPDTLSAVTSDGSTERILCPYPLVAAYNGGNQSSASSFSCQANFS